MPRSSSLKVESVVKGFSGTSEHRSNSIFIEFVFATPHCVFRSARNNRIGGSLEAQHKIGGGETRVYRTACTRPIGHTALSQIMEDIADVDRIEKMISRNE